MATELKALQKEKENVRLKKDGGRAGSRRGDFEGNREGKLVSPERRRRTIAEVHCRLEPQKVSECRVLDQPRSTQQHQSHRPNDEPRLLGEMRAMAR